MAGIMFEVDGAVVFEVLRTTDVKTVLVQAYPQIWTTHIALCARNTLQNDPTHDGQNEKRNFLISNTNMFAWKSYTYNTVNVFVCACV